MHEKTNCSEGDAIFSAAVLTLVMATEPIVLDNGLLRVEVDPRLFSVRFVGHAGDSNYVEALETPGLDEDGANWVDSGGIATSLIPYKGKDAAIHRGPAEVTEKTATSVSLLGPFSTELGIRLRKDVVLAKGELKALFRVTAIARDDGKPHRFALRNTVRVAPPATLRVPRSGSTLRMLAGGKAISPAVVAMREYWLIPTPPTGRLNGIVMGAFVPTITQQHRTGTWTRTLKPPPDDPKSLPNECTCLVLLDDATKNYASVLQGALTDITTSNPAILEEEWTFTRWRR